jgi:hypothetical protein
LAAGEVSAALKHLEQVEEATRFSHASLKTELLLRLNRFAEAALVAKNWSQHSDATPQEIGSLVDLLTDYGQGAAADEALQAAMKTRDWPPQVRSDLLRRRALLQTGLVRLRLLIDAAVTLPTRTPPRAAALEAIAGELTQSQHVEFAAQLAEEAAATDVRTVLLHRQAELTRRGAEAMRIGWQLQAAGQLPASRLPWLCGVTNQAGQPQRVIEKVEGLLRQGANLSDATLFELATAYRLSGRKLDARRATTCLLDGAAAEAPTEARSSGVGFF